MKLIQLFFRFKGRIRRRDWWLASIGLFVTITAIEFAAHQLLTGRPPQSYLDDANGWTTLQPEPYYLLQLALKGLSLWPTVAIGAKRWHDRDRPGWLPLVIVLVSYAFLFVQGSTNTGSWLFYIGLGAVSFALNVWQLVECGFWDGKGPNTYGPSPKGIAAAEDVF